MGKRRLDVRIGAVDLSSPVMIASGTCGYGSELLELSGFDWDAVGAIVLKGTTLNPRKGNPPPRIAEVPGGVINSIGLENPGVDKVVSQILPKLTALPAAVIANVAGFTVAEYVEVTARLSSAEKVSAIELNVSCPNVEEGSAEFGQKKEGLAELVSAVRKATELPLIVKLSPDVQPIIELAKAALDSGADALSLVNTAKAMAIDVRSRKPVLGNATGGLSGPALKAIAVERVHEVFSATPGTKIIGMGGISSAEDALEFVMAGASAVAVGTSFLIDPNVCSRIASGIADYLDEHGMDSLQQLVGTASGS